MDIQNATTDALFRQYIHVVNQALGENRDHPIYGTTTKLGEKALDGREFQVGVYKDDASHPHDWFVLKMSDGTIDVQKHGRIDDALFDAKVAREHLENVVDDAESFIEQPAKLDLDWLKTRIAQA